MPGMGKILQGILRYRKYDHQNIIEQFKSKPYAVFFACMDHRVIVSKLTHSEVGDGYIVRNAGNMIPHHSNFQSGSISTEPGALELGCVINSIKNVVICGHSDCKGMKGLYEMRDDKDKHIGTPLQQWLKRNGNFTLDKFRQLTPDNSYQGPLEFQGENGKFSAYIDKENVYPMYDKLSQVNCLQQVENVVSYDFMQQDGLRIHSMWFDIDKGEVHLFSRSKQKFLVVNEENFDHLIQDTSREIRASDT